MQTLLKLTSARTANKVIDGQMTTSTTSNLRAAYDILRNRERGLDYLDVSADGVLDSFKGLALAGVIDGLALMATHSTRKQLGDENVGNIFAASIGTLAIALTAYLISMVALYFLCRYFECENRFTTALVANNWAAPIVSLGFLPISLLILALGVNDGSAQTGQAGALILMVAIVILIALGIRILRISLGVTIGRAVMLFCGSTFVSLLIDDALRSFFNV